MTVRTHSKILQQPDTLRFLLTSVLVIGILYAGRPVILPLAMAVLLTFVLTPMVVLVQKRGIKRVPAVLVVLLFTVSVFGGLGYSVYTQVEKLADHLPDYAKGINHKIDAVRSNGSSPFSKGLSAIEDIGTSAQKSTGAAEATTRPIIVEKASDSALERVTSVASTVLSPVADVAMVFVLVAFMLIRKEDVRNRIIGLLGHGKLTGTTRVFVDSAERISQLLVMQLCVNTAFGTVFGLVLLALGVQYWFLWGFLSMLLRFVPYIGSWVAAMLPVMLSFAASPGWTQPLAVLGSFIVLDLVTGNAVEPVLFAHSTGVTPLALLVAAIFWTWVWGPLGLLLSTPLTVCLVVMGQNIPSLRFLSLLMGETAALEPHIAYYQRLLAGDDGEALLIAKQFADLKGLDHVPDHVILPAIRKARLDRSQAGLEAADEAFIFDSTEKIIARIMPTPAEAVENLATPACPLVIGCAAHHRAEELALQMLVTALRAECMIEILTTRMLPSEIEARVEKDNPAVLFIAIVPPGGVSQAKHLCRRLRKRFVDLKIVVGYFGKVRDFDRLLTSLRAAGASYVSTSLSQSKSQIRSLLPATPVVAVEIKTVKIKTGEVVIASTIG